MLCGYYEELVMATQRFAVKLDGASISQSIPLLKEVNRIGSSECCEILLQVQFPHVATVICMKDSVEVINRTSAPLICGKSRITPGGRSQWTVGQQLRIENYQLVLTTSRVTDNRFASGSGSDSQGEAAEATMSASGLSGRPILLIAGLALGGFVLSALMGGEPAPDQHRLKNEEFADCVVDLHRGIDDFRIAAESYQRLSMLAMVVLGVEANASSRTPTSDRIKLASEQCRVLAQRVPDSAPEDERRLTERFATLLLENNGAQSFLEDRRFRKSLEDLSLLLEQQRLDSEVYSRLTTLSDVVSRYKLAQSGNRHAGNADQQDAVNYCRSLAETTSSEVSDMERELARRFAALVADGV